jgi:pyruvate/2-oxoglutarate dehydrogenase complex dihydrolipoamide acyltransferase (E2) component
MADMRKCIGSAKFGIAAHEAPVGDFPTQPSQKDGLGRMCKPHWTEYTRALRKAKGGASKAASTGTPPIAHVSNQQRRAAAQAAGKVPAADGTVPIVETPSVQVRRRKLGADLEAVGVGTDEGQRILESAAD